MMRWRSTEKSSAALSSESTVEGHDSEIQTMSSMDDDEPDSSSQEPVYSGSGGSKDLHGRLGGSESSDLPPLLDDDEKASLEQEEKKDQDNNNNNKGLASSSSSSDQPRDESSNQKQDNNAVIEDDDGLDHSQPPDDASETDTPVIPWTAQSTQSTCEFTHTIVNYAQKRESGCKKAEYSATTVDEFGNRWRLIVYVNGNGRASNHHLSLFLQVADADDLPFGWKKAVSYVLTLEHPGGNNLSYAKRNPDKTFKLCPKAIDWGWSQFITSDRIQQEGFVSNDSLTVRASVTVKSSSVSIDAEDAELYLKCAVEEGRAEAVKLCLAQGASVNCKFKDDLYTPLHTACSSGTNGGSMEVLNLLLERGADGNACNKWRETPLLIAANNGHRAAVEALLKHGADPSLCSEAGWSALTFAAHKGYDDIVALLLRAGAPVNCRVTEDSSTPLHKACAGSKPGHLSGVKQLLDGGADVHALNKWRETPLLTAANHGQSGAVEALLKAGADPCKCTDTGWSPLSIAAYKGHDSVVKLLLEEGAPTEEADPTLSALLQAATKGLPDTVELLLRHGADHTVTTKKGDTALSILVEQNLIDAAVEMVTEYKASVPRCSRDRKKVQRARLLINLRMKQHEKEGRRVVSTDVDQDEDDDDDDDETDDEDSEEAKLAQHDESGSPTAATPRGKKKKKTGSNKIEAEEQAKAAEEALLLELEEEDAKAKKEEAEANSKRAKNKKKKERLRQQKQKEEQERREQEEKEAMEKERLRREKEEQARKERQQKLKEQREKELKDAAEREKVAAAKRKEKEEKDRRQRELELKNRDKERQTHASISPSGSVASEKRGKQKNKAAPNKAVSSSATNNGVSESVHSAKVAAPAVARSAGTAPTAARSVAVRKNRGWETKPHPPAKQPQNQPASKPAPGKAAPATPVNETPNPILPPQTKVTPPVPTTFLAPRPSEPSGDLSYLPFDQRQQAALMGGAFPSSDDGSHRVGAHAPPVGDHRNAFPAASGNATEAVPDSSIPMQQKVLSVEHPAVALFRREKVSELFQRCRLSLGVVDEQAIKRVLYRWIVRAAHGQATFMDCIIPSWVDFDQLVTYFQRQFIAESRRGMRGSSGHPEMVNMETLRDAGSSMAGFCHNLAKEVVQFRVQMEDQLPGEWTDSALRVSASEVRNGGGIGVVVDWANRSQLYFSAREFSTLRARYVGPPNKFLSNIFAAKTRYETKRMVLVDSVMDLRLPPRTKASFSSEASVSAELWSDPFSALSSNVFWGNFKDVDAPFGGLMPFARDEGGGEELLSRHGGSVLALLPFDNMVASRYVHRMLDILESSDADRVPVSFSVFVHNDCFHDLSAPPSINDLHLLDPRLGSKKIHFLRRVEQLAAGQHIFFCGDGDGVPKVSASGSLFILLQNEAAKSCFQMSDSSFIHIVQSMTANVSPANDIGLVTSIGFNGDYALNDPAVQQGYFDGLAPMSPTPQQPALMDFGAIGGGNINKAFSPQPTQQESRRAPQRRGRLFELVDDGEEDNLNDVDVVSGMLGNLNVDLFQNNVSQEVDIEAISLMGIGGPPSRQLPPGNPRSTSRFS